MERLNGSPILRSDLFLKRIFSPLVFEESVSADTESRFSDTTHFFEGLRSAGQLGNRGSLWGA
jgi:hypothetical protein